MPKAGASPTPPAHLVTSEQPRMPEDTYHTGAALRRELAGSMPTPPPTESVAVSSWPPMTFQQGPNLVTGPGWPNTTWANWIQGLTGSTGASEAHPQLAFEAPSATHMPKPPFEQQMDVRPKAKSENALVTDTAQFRRKVKIEGCPRPTRERVFEKMVECKLVQSIDEICGLPDGHGYQVTVDGGGLGDGKVNYHDKSGSIYICGRQPGKTTALEKVKEWTVQCTEPPKKKQKRKL